MLFRYLVVASLLASVSAHAVCNVCGEGMAVTAPDVFSSYPGEPVLTCSGLEAAGFAGWIPEDECAQIAKYVSSCNCEALITQRITQESDPPATSVPDGESPSEMPSGSPSFFPSAVPSVDPSDTPTMAKASDAARLGVWVIAAVVGAVSSLA